MKIEEVFVSAYTVPTDAPESDGTLTWDKTTMVLVEARAAGGITGLGYTYADVSTAAFVRNILVPLVEEADPMNIVLSMDGNDPSGAKPWSNGNGRHRGSRRSTMRYGT